MTYRYAIGHWPILVCHLGKLVHFSFFSAKTLRYVHMKALLIALSAVTLVVALAAAQQSPIQSCRQEPRPAWCNAVQGDRSEGWLSQSRSEVMGRNGIVATSQPLAAQAGLDILK